MKLKHEIATGDILLKESFPIGKDDTTGEVHDHMKEVGAKLLVKTVEGLMNKTLVEKTQSSVVSSESAVLKHAPKIFSETCKIDSSKTVDEVHNLIRGLSPFPGAFTTLHDKMLKIYRSKKEVTAVQAALSGQTSGEFSTDGKTFLKFACSDGYVQLLEIQLEGKKKMLIEDFLRGYRFS